MLEPAILVHRTDERLRLRFPARRKDPVYLEGVTRWALGMPGVLAGTSNPFTASLLLRHAADFSLPAFAAAAAEAEWFELPLPPLRPPPPSLPTDPLALAHLLEVSTRKRYQPWAFGVLLGLGAVQMTRDRWLPPALTLLWYARELAADKGHDTSR